MKQHINLVTYLLLICNIASGFTDPLEQHSISPSFNPGQTRTIEDPVVRISLNVINDDDGNGGLTVSQVDDVKSSLTDVYSEIGIRLIFTDHHLANECDDFDVVNNICNINNDDFADPPFRNYCIFEDGTFDYDYEYDCFEEGGVQEFFALLNVNDIFDTNDISSAVRLYLLPDNISHGVALTKTPLPSKEILVGGALDLFPDFILRETNAISHELGHAFGLLHTFSQFYDGLTEVNLNTDPLVGPCRELVCRPDDQNCTSNCLECGDDVCDTDADPNKWFFIDYNEMTGECTYNGDITREYDCEDPVSPCNNDQVGVPYTPEVYNIMAYTHVDCMDNFSDGQASRMLDAIDQELDDVYFEYGCGDVNDDETLDVLDIVAIVTYILGDAEFDQEEQFKADLNDDLYIDVLDIIVLVSIIIGSSSESPPLEPIMITSILEEINQDSTYMDIWLATETIVDGIQVEIDVNNFGYNAIGVDSTYYADNMAFGSNISEDSTEVKMLIFNTAGDSLAADTHGTIARIWLTEDGTTSSPDSTDFTKQIFANMDNGGSYIDHEYGTLAEFKSYICDIDSTYCYGCTDNEALNYNLMVTIDDTSCVYLLGDMNASESLNVSDVVIMNGIILETITPTAYQEFAGDMDGDGDIDVADVVILLDIIMSQRSMERDGGEGEILISKEVNPYGIYDGEDASLTITLYNEPIVRAMLVTIDLEENYLVSSINLGERAISMDIQHRIFDNDTKLSFILYSSNGYDIDDGIGSILEVGLQSVGLGRSNASDVGVFNEIQIVSLDAEFLDYNVLQSDEMTSLVNSGILPSAIPTSYSLHPAYPNPFNPVVNLSYSIPENGNVSLIVYDMLGHEVVQLVNEQKQADYYSVKWDASGYASGAYFVKFTSGEFTQTQKIALVK